MAGDEEEDDYLSMTFEDATPKKETSLQRTKRLKEESAARGRIPSKAERAEADRQKLETALATEIDSSNKGAQMMAKMGFKGGALGKSEGARTRPIEIQVKEDRGGIGIEHDKKRKIREAAEAFEVQEKRAKLDENDYREQKRLERQEKRQEAQWWSAMRLLEGFETDTEAEKESDENGTEGKPPRPKGKTHIPLRSANVLWRPLLKNRYEKERDRRMRYDLAQSLSRKTDYTEDDKDESLAYGNEVEEDLDDEDEELTGYEAMPIGERLEKLLNHLREQYHYCFWCKYKYPDETMDGCPGLTEDEHG